MSANIKISTADTGILGLVDDPNAFRAAVRAWLADAMSRRSALDAKDLGDDIKPDYCKSQQWWMTEQNKVRLATPHWPSEFGGADLSLGNQIIIAEEMARAGAPPMTLFIVSLYHLPATLIAWGTPYQKAKYLPGVAQGVVWCQGFSEPNAGSDLASLGMRAERRGDHYIVNGQKIWSSNSMYADHCVLLARTNPEVPRHGGISYFLLDMKAPGVEVRPIRQSNGEAEFAELFLTDVKIPVEERVGEENQGWAVAQTTLSAERGVLSFENGERFRYMLENFHAAAVARDAPWLKDAELRRMFVRLFAEMQACRRLLRRLLCEIEENSTHAAATVVHVKVINTNLRKAIGDFMLKTQGLEGQWCLPPHTGAPDHPIFTYISAFGHIIAGGTNEIMRNIIAERLLGMPKT
jgi:alkylation response protein AidB-like acyl-CoA dehydrogenase